ncbi:MAG: hypothetical protein ACXVW6_12205 [Nocardioidaceae bacterium]
MPGRLYGRWLVLVTAGELAGFCVPAAVGAATTAAPAAVTLVLMVAAGSVEGAVLGTAQARVLTLVVPGLDPGRWVRATAAGAAVAWLLGMLPSTAYPLWRDWPVAPSLAVGTVLGTALLLSIGVAQATVLRRYVAGAASWVGWTALAWLAGLGVLLSVAMPLWQPDQGVVLIAAIGVLGGFAMALAMAAVTGVAVLRVGGRLRARAS